MLASQAQPVHHHEHHYLHQGGEVAQGSEHREGRGGEGGGGEEEEERATLPGKTRKASGKKQQDVWELVHTGPGEQQPVCCSSDVLPGERVPANSHVLGQLPHAASSPSAKERACVCVCV